MVLPFDQWSGRQLNIIAQANRLRRLHDGYKLPDYQRNLVVVLLLTQGDFNIMKPTNLSTQSLLISCLFLSACAGTMNGMIRESGKPVTISYTQAMLHDNLQVTMPDGEIFTGKAVISDQSTSTIMVGTTFGTGQRSTGSVQAILFGSKHHTMNCKLQYADSSGDPSDGGVGICETSNGKTIDVQW